jgi:hypothetical protein
MTYRYWIILNITHYVCGVSQDVNNCSFIIVDIVQVHAGRIQSVCVDLRGRVCWWWRLTDYFIYRRAYFVMHTFLVKFYLYLFRREWLWYGKLIVKSFIFIWIQYTELKLSCRNDPVVKNYIYSNGDLDLWPNDPKVNRVPIYKTKFIVRFKIDLIIIMHIHFRMCRFLLLIIDIYPIP